MDPRSAALTANAASFVVFGLLAFWYVVPWLRAQGRERAITALLWVHAFRYVALELFSAERAGLAIPPRLRDQIAYGDLLGAVLAVVCILALRRASPGAIPLTWL